jgi:hypothetical protein
LQVVVVAAATVVVEEVLVESSTRPTTQSHLAQPTPLTLVKAVMGATKMVVLGATLSSLRPMIHRTG